MIAYITGELITTKQEGIVVEQNGMGYNIMMPLSAISSLPNNGSLVKIYTFLYVREDNISLYGFLSQDDLQVFKQLITVSGIGPKVALAILSSMTADDLRFAVLAEDVKTITKAPGVGTKTAKKLILELKDKFKLEDSFESRLANNENVSSTNGDNIIKVRNETIEALTFLGYSRSDAVRAARSIKIEEGMTVEELIKLSLKELV